jgi:iron complex transport system permease protein
MNKRILILLLYILPVPVLLVSLFVGPSDVAPTREILKSVFGFLSGNPVSGSDSKILQAVVFDVRLPRILLTFLTGSALAVSGCSIQAIFRNPLTDPYILGLSSGAAFGAALAMAFIFIPVQLSAFVFGLLAVGLSYFMARKNGNVSVVSLILSGIIVSGIFTALLTVVQYFSDPFKLQSIVHWTMGNLHNAGWKKLQSAFIPILAGILVMFIYRWRMNVLALGEDEARTAGINPDKDKLIILLAATLASSSAVAVAGIIGLYGLIVPHIVRMMIGPDNKQTIPLNFVFGGTFLLMIDNFSRTVSGFEIPIGVFTMLLGAPFFIFLMKKTNIGWER